MSFLRWAGSKKQLGDTLAQFWYATQCAGASGRYIEAFCGSASFFFLIKPASSILIDINPHIIECLASVRELPEELFELLQTYPTTQQFYYELRSKNSDNLSPLERSARFIYLNRYCFNGLYRTNRQGHFNVPYGGGLKNGSLPTLEILKNAARDLINSNLINADFDRIIFDQLQPGDFVYLDPPYAKINHSLDLQYGPDVFGTRDLERLYKLLEHIEASNAYFVFSYIECDEVRDFVARWSTHRVQVNRTIAASTDRRKKASEVLISNL